MPLPPVLLVSGRCDGLRSWVLAGLARVLLRSSALRPRPAADDQQRHRGAQQGDGDLGG
jgi:hypothetical protein